MWISRAALERYAKSQFELGIAVGGMRARAEMARERAAKVKSEVAPVRKKLDEMMQERYK
jgi:hypothetical protein